MEEAEVIVELEEKFHQSQTYREIAQERSELVAENPDDLAEQLDALLTEQRAACKDFYNQQKEEFYREIGLDESYFEGSAYSGFLTVVPEEFAAQARPDLFVERLTQSEMTCKISVDDPHTLEQAGWFGSWEGETLPTIHGEGWDVYNGNGIRVGILEARGVADLSFFANNYPDLNIVTEANLPVSDHATRVSAIIAALAPKCTMLSTMVDAPGTENGPPPVGSEVEDYGVDFLNNYNVQIVNCSFVFAGYHRDVSYCGIDEMYNNYAIDNDMTFVFASGNEHNSYVSCPNESPYLITVGATDNNGSTKAGYSNYGSKTGLVKPLLTGNGAPHVPYLNDPFHTQYGTSLAAPMVTGALVKAAQKDYLIQYPVYAIPALASTATHENLSGGTFESNGIVNNYFGYGMLNINNLMLNTATVMNPNNNLHREDSDAFDTDTERVSTRILGAGTKIRASLFWIGDVNLNLYVYGPNGNLITSSTSTNRKPEVVEFIAPTYGEYTLKMVRVGSPATCSSDIMLFYAYLL